MSVCVECDTQPENTIPDVIENLFVDLSVRFFKDVSNVVEDGDLAERVRSIRADLTHFPQLERTPVFYSNLQELQRLPVLMTGESPLVLSDIVAHIPAEWHDTTYTHAWLLAAVRHVYAYPQFFSMLKSYIIGDDSPQVPQVAAADDGKTSDVAAIQFDEYLGRLKETPDKHDKREQLDTIFDNAFNGDGIIARMAKEITQELNLDFTQKCFDNNCRQPTSLSNLLDLTSSNNIFPAIIEKVGSKLHEKLASQEVKQEDLIGEAMRMLQTLHSSGVPNFANDIMGGNMMKMMQGLMPGGGKAAHPAKARGLQRNKSKCKKI